MNSSSTSASVLRGRRNYNQWVANETFEDFALRHTARRARRWSFARITNTALGTSAFLVLELLGATIALNYGVLHSLWAISVVCLLLFCTGIPISYYATRYSVDIDLLTRGAGFGYIGSTISSLIYASFTFIFFALEAAIMASALELLFGLPLWLGYIVSVIVVIPLVTHGITMISRFQLVTQPIWLVLQLMPIAYIAQHPDGLFTEWLNYAGLERGSESPAWSWLTFGSAATVLLALVAQIGEQVDFLRFLPEKQEGRRLAWWASVLLAGPGWVVMGALKLALGALMAFILVADGSSAEHAASPTHMYTTIFEAVVQSPGIALVIAVLFVVICQLKINVANAYAGSLAWSNFFSRLTHHHPGRVVWLVFNVSIALMLMELGVFRAIETVLHHYSAFVLAWFGSIVADLMINKPLGLSPKHIEFKRSQLCDINPVGVGSTLIATLVGVASSTGFLGEFATAFSGFIAFFIPFLCVPLIALVTRSRYYLANGGLSATQNIEIYRESLENIPCTVCQNKFDREDISVCPSYGGNICSLCCALETRCGDKCRPESHIGVQLKGFFEPIIGSKKYTILSGPLGHFSVIFTTVFLITLCVFYLPYVLVPDQVFVSHDVLVSTLVTIFFLLLIVVGVIVWLFVLAQKSTKMALEDTSLQTQKLSQEIRAHEITSGELERARKSADSANVAKSQYVTALSHELRTPLNVILGYAQILQNDADIPRHQQDSLGILRRNGEHLATMIEGLLEISKIEAGKLNLNNGDVRLDILLDQLVKMFSQQASAKNLYFHHEIASSLPKSIRTDEKRLRQILINLISNAIKFTDRGGVIFSVSYRSHVARFSVHDTGHGIPEEALQHIFVPFERGPQARERHIPGSGLGLAICRQLVDLMGAEIEVQSEVGKGSRFTLILQASPVELDFVAMPVPKAITGYRGTRRSVLIVDDNEDHRQLIADLLSPIGFDISHAESFNSCLQVCLKDIDLVLLDVRLGEESGWELLERLREISEKLPIVMISANARGLYSEPSEKRLHDDYLEKPLQLDALLEKIGTLLEIKWEYTSNSGKENAETQQNLERDIKPLNQARWNEFLHFTEIGNFNQLKSYLETFRKDEEISSKDYHTLMQTLNSFDFVELRKRAEDIAERDI